MFLGLFISPFITPFNTFYYSSVIYGEAWLFFMTQLGDFLDPVF
jgi:hypothetical protein